MNKVLFTGFDKVKWQLAGYSRSSEENQIVANLVFSSTAEALKNGLSVCIEQGFMKKDFLKPYLDLAQKANVPIHIFQLEAPKRVLLERVCKRPKPEQVTSSITQEKIEQNIDNYFRNKYQNATVIDTSNKKPLEIANVILINTGVIE